MLDHHRQGMPIPLDVVSDLGDSLRQPVTGPYTAAGYFSMDRPFWRKPASAAKMKTLPHHSFVYMKPSDIAAVVRLDRLACTYTDPDLGDIVHHDAWTEESLCEFTNPDNHVVSMVQDEMKRLVGYMAYRIIKGTFRIVALAVHPDRRRRGYASCLLNRLADAVLRSTVTKVIVAHVREHDDASIHFYKFHGFRSLLVRNHFGEGQDAIRFFYEETGTITENERN